MYTLLKGVLSDTVLGDSAAAFISGGAAGVGAWIPIYPFDVIKTNIQNTQGTKGEGFLATALRLQRTFGWGVFYDGVQPKLLRAAVNHSVTFWVYNLILNWVSAAAS